MSDKEIGGNAKAFRAALGPKLASNVQVVVAAHAAKLDDAYARLTTLQAWRSYVLESHLPPASLGFYSEAQNDGLTSIVLVAGGLWRPAMKSLRSLLENVLHCLYYMDHPVEYRHWESGKHRPSFQKLFEYFDAHPDITGLPESLKPIPDIKKHYGLLSDIVHASAREVRMTDDINQTNIWKTTSASLGQWSTMQKNIVREANLLILTLLKAHLQGAANKGLREALALSIPSGKDTAIRANLGVRIIRS